MTERPPRPDTGSLLWTRWREVDRIFDAALDLPVGDRADFLRDQCAGDTALFDLVAELLKITDTADTTLDRPGTSLLWDALRDDDEPPDSGLEPGTRRGR